MVKPMYRWWFSRLLEQEGPMGLAYPQLWKCTPGLCASVCARGHTLTTEDCGTDGGQADREAGNDRDALAPG